MQSLEGARHDVAERFRWQAKWCATLGSSLYAGLLEAAAGDLEAGGTVWDVVAGHEADPVDSMLPLRFMGSVHRLVLAGRAPELAAFYPSTGGEARGEAWPVFRSVVEAQGEELRKLIVRGVQTNEVGRAGALVGGFLVVARETGLPLRILECGASAGLLLRWDRYRYEARGATWGPADSAVRLCDYNSDVPLPFDVTASVAERAGCDVNPLDPTSEEGRLTLLSYVWPDQIQRIRSLRGALAIARDVAVTVERASAPEWIAQQLNESRDGVATVVYHSIFFQYMSPDQRADFVTAIEGAGARATKDAPLAWLRFEPGGDEAEVRLKMWPGANDALLAESGFHGAAVRWLA